MIKNIIFDVGGTYLAGSASIFVRKASRLSGINDNQLKVSDIIFDADLNRGTISHDKCFRKLFGASITAEQLRQIKDLWTSTWELQAEMRDLIKSLKKNYTLSILSNSDSLNSEKYKSKGWYAPFDPIILSHETGILKPDPQIYRIIFDRLSVPAYECLFIDDQIEALEPAKNLGMDTVLYESIASLKQSLKQKGITY